MTSDHKLKAARIDNLRRAREGGPSGHEPCCASGDLGFVGEGEGGGEMEGEATGYQPLELSRSKGSKLGLDHQPFTHHHHYRPLPSQERTT